MAGGLMQLIATGAQDQYLSIAPEFSFWKQVYRRHTNFSMQSVQNTFLSKPTLDSSAGSFTCRIGRYGDLLQQVYLGFTLPAIYSDNDMRFRWIGNVANYMIRSYSVSIDTQTIDQKWGEWSDIWNELTMTSDRKFGYDRMTGNIEEFTAPKSLKPLTILNNNRFSYSYYPIASNGTPSIPSKTFYIPLDFWFCKNPSLALPLVALQYQTINITIELRSIEEIYQIYDIRTNTYFSPTGYRSLPYYDGRDVSIANFSAFEGGGPSSIDINAFLECNYIFLDTLERNTIAANSADFLIERVYRTNYTGIVSGGQQSVDLIIANPVKEFVWVLRRGNAYLYNDWRNYSSTTPENPLMSTLNSAKIVWNGSDRIDEKNGAYFNLLQPYQHHCTTPRDGIYSYSFALNPEKINPSGSFNASMINKIQLYLSTNPTIDNTDYEIVVYTLYNNIFRVISGSGSMVFAS